jgi:aspartokinase
VNDYGAVTQFLLENPPAGIATGAVGTALLVAFLLRLFRNEVRSAAIDRAAQTLLESVQHDNENLRERIKEAEVAREGMRRELFTAQEQFGNRVAAMTSAVEQLTIDKRQLQQKLDGIQQELTESKTEQLRLEMQVAGQLSTIEDLGYKIRQLESRVGKLGEGGASWAPSANRPSEG